MKILISTVFLIFSLSAFTQQNDTTRLDSIFDYSNIFTEREFTQGKIVIKIKVDPSGRVIHAENALQKSTINDSLLINDCIQKAYKTVWSSASREIGIQVGYITYSFKPNKKQ